MDGFSEHAGGTQDASELAPPCCGTTCLFHQFAPGGVLWRFTRLEPASGQFPDPAAGGRPELAQQADALHVVHGHHGGPSRVMHDLVAGRGAIGQGYLLHIHRDYASLEYGFNLVHVCGASVWL